MQVENESAAPSAEPIAQQQDSRLTDRAAFVAEVQKAQAEAAAPKDAPAETPAEEQPEAPKEDGAPEEVEEDDTTPDTVELAPAPEEKPALNDDAQKRLALVQREVAKATEERHRLAEERRQFEVERRALEEFRHAQARAKYDPAAALRALGVEPDEGVARLIYEQTKAAETDPRFRESATREMRYRELDHRYSQQAEKISQLEQMLTRQTEEKALNEYLDTVKGTVNGETPIVSQLMAKNPRRAMTELREVAEALYAETGEPPEPGDVAKILEKRRRSELEELGVDVTSFQTKTTKTKTQPAGEPKTANTLTNDLGKTTTPRTAPPTYEDERAATLAEIEKLWRQEAQ